MRPRAIPPFFAPTMRQVRMMTTWRMMLRVWRAELASKAYLPGEQSGR
jgi:hypothetical protein